MSFLLYAVADNTYRFQSKLEGTRSLWGMGGLLARTVGPKVTNGGPWSVTDQELLASLHESNSVILDDLIPDGPEILMARIKEIRGYLDVPFSSNQIERYNPILIVMEEVMSVAPGVELSERARLKESIPLSAASGQIIRSVNYLVKSWVPPRGFGGALLWDRHWDSLLGKSYRAANSASV
jgi:hypothetical protein